MQGFCSKKSSERFCSLRQHWFSGVRKRDMPPSSDPRIQEPRRWAFSFLKKDADATRAGATANLGPDLNGRSAESRSPTANRLSIAKLRSYSNFVVLLMGSQALVACGLVGAPSLILSNDEHAASTTVGDVIKHIACELSTSMYLHLHDPNGSKIYPQGDTIVGDNTPVGGDSSNYELWKHLIEDNFNAKIVLELQVTNSEAVNPSMNFITPFNPIPIPSLSSTGASQFSSFAGNYTLAVGAQLTGNQYRTFSFTYNIALARLWQGMRREIFNSDADLKEAMPWVHYEGDRLTLASCDSNEVIGPNGTQHTQLAGDLHLNEVLEDGLESIKLAKAYGLYSTPDAQNAYLPPGPESPDLAVRRRELGLQVRLPKVGGTSPEQPAFKKESIPGKQSVFPEVTIPGLPAPAKPPERAAKPSPPRPGSRKQAAASQAPANAQPQAPISFEQDIDFTIAAGVNGGPNWTLTHFSGPTGGGGGGGGKSGGGSGGGGGSSGGGSSGGGSGGGGNQGFFNVNRTATDSLTITVSATCRITKKTTGPFRTYWDAVPRCGGSTIDQENIKTNQLKVDQDSEINRLTSALRRLAVP
jgi:uncharacterized membrane protein YgcG